MDDSAQFVVDSGQSGMGGGFGMKFQMADGRRTAVLPGVDPIALRAA